MAPIYDTGNALFYNQEIVPSKANLLDIPVNSFCKREVDMLRYVKVKEGIDLEQLRGFSQEVEELLQSYTNMPMKRIQEIAQIVEQKIEYLRLFQQGKQIWKKEKYW